MLDMLSLGAENVIFASIILILLRILDNPRPLFSLISASTSSSEIPFQS